LDGDEMLLVHEAPYSIWGTNDALDSKLFVDAAVAVAPSMMVKYSADGLTHLGIATLALSWDGGMVVAAAWYLKAAADLAQAVTCTLRNDMDHPAELCWGLLPRIIAAFFKMSFSAWRRAFSRRNARKASASDCSPTAWSLWFVGLRLVQKLRAPQKEYLI
jgi:hypothetical protein